MSVMRKTPFIEYLIGDLTAEQKKSLLDAVNGSGNTINASISNMPASAITPVLFQFDANDSKTGILVQSASYRVLICYHRFQDLLMFKFDDKNNYQKVNEYLDINELRRLLEEVSDHVTSGEIDSGEADAGLVLTADGEGGASWENMSSVFTEDNVNEGDAVKLFGFDAQGNLVQDDIPEGIDVDETIIEDSPNAVAGGAVYDALADVDAEMETKANVDGNYQTMTVGLANNFDSKLTENDKSAYNFRPTATMGSVELEVGSPCKVKKIIGGTVALNQLVSNATDSATLGTGTCSYSRNAQHITVSGTYVGGGLSQRSFCQYNPKYGHKYLFLSSKELTGSSFQINDINSSGTTYAGIHTNKSTIIASQNSQNISTEISAYFNAGDAGEKNVDVYVSFIDLTQMFGSTIADYIYTLETTAPGAGVAWFRRYFNKSYYTYNAGQLVSVMTQGKKITRFNQFDEQVESGYWNDSTGQKVSSSSWYRNANPIKVEPNTTYYAYFENTPTNGELIYRRADGSVISYLGSPSSFANHTFTTPIDCYDIVFYCDSLTGKINFNFHYDGERDGEYEPYDSETYPCEVAELRGIPQLDSNNNLAFDGDEYNSDGSENVRYAEHTFTGSEEWTFSEENQRWQTLINMGAKNNSKQICSNGLVITTTPGAIRVLLGNNPQLSSSSNMNSLFTNSTKIVYELATPTTDNLDPFTETQECDNWGTEQWLAPTSDTRPCEVPVGHDTDYLPDLKAKVESAPTTPSEDGYYVLEHDETAEGNPNSYADMDTVLTSKGYVKQEDLSTDVTDAAELTYTAKKLISNGTTKTLNILAQNNTGSTIAAETKLLELPSYQGPIFVLRFVGVVQNTPATFYINNGALYCMSAINDSALVTVSVTYIRN